MKKALPFPDASGKWGKAGIALRFHPNSAEFSALIPAGNGAIRPALALRFGRLLRGGVASTNCGGGFQPGPSLSVAAIGAGASSSAHSCPYLAYLYPSTAVCACQVSFSAPFWKKSPPNSPNSLDTHTLNRIQLGLGFYLFDSPIK